MKLKRLPEDFRVDEQVAIDFAARAGAFTVYRLKKKSLGTLEAVGAIAHHWKIPRQAIAFAGLKDKHALTTQYISIQRGPRRSFRQQSIELMHVGSLERPIHASDITSNRFSVVLRNLEDSQVAAIGERTRQGDVVFANYFDNQRFGSLGESNEFIALAWCRGDYERALWLALADSNPRDTAAVRAEKEFLRAHWGDWSACRRRCVKSQFAAVINHLAGQPTDFRRAIARVAQELRSLWLAAFQSHLWNQVLATLIVDALPEDELSWRTIGGRRVPFFSASSSTGWEMRLPLPSARLHLDDERLVRLYERALSAEGLALRELRVKYPRDSFFSKGEREAVGRARVQYAAGADELHPGRQKAALDFSLVRGQYATMLVKCVAGQWLSDASEGQDE